MAKYIITILGKDRPGIIAAVTRALYEQNFNIEDVRQTILQSEFSGIFIVTGPGGSTGFQLKEALTAATDPLNLNCHVKNMEPPQAQISPSLCEPFVISTRGPDAKGLVAEIAAVLASRQVNVTQLQAAFRGGNEPDDNIMVYEVDVPVDIDLSELRRELDAKAAEFNLEVNFQHKNIFKVINRI